MAAGGFKMSLGGLKAKPGLKAVAAKNDTKAKKALLGDDEPDETNKAQEIAGFDAAEGGAIDINGAKEKKGPLVIPSLPNRNWREEARRKQLERAPHTQQQNGDVVMDEPEKEVVYGLSVPTKATETQENGTTQTPEPMEVDAQDDLTDAQRLEKQALESLLTGKATDTARIVPAITDEEALANDLADAPDEPDIDAYEATPIEGFGLAMLRGMGWKDSDGESRTKNGAKAPRDVKRRPALLGIGAKEDAAKDVELGEFNSKARGNKGKKDAPQGYNPVTLRNKKTGQVITEEELKKKLESQDLVAEEKAERKRDEDGEKGERRRDRDTDRRDDRDRDRRRDEEYTNESRRDRNHRDHRRRDRHDDDTDRRRERRRDRSRDGEHDSARRSEKRRDRHGRDRSRSRSRSPRDDRRRDRYRSRSRDAKDRRDRRDGSRSRDDEGRRRRRKEREHEDERDGRRRRDREERSSRK